MVVTPGATMSFNSLRIWRTMLPLRRIFSISDCDLQTIATLLISFAGAARAPVNFLQKRIQPRRLLLGSRKAVEHESSLRIRFPQPPSDNIANQVIGNQFAFSQKLTNLLAQRCSLLHVLAKQISG